MLVTYTGRRSGRTFTTPVRYLVRDAKIRSFTSSTNQWWRNMRGGAEVVLLVAGRKVRCRAEAIADDPARVREALSEFLAQFPQDAPYYEVDLDGRRAAVPGDLDRASLNTVMVEATPLE